MPKDKKKKHKHDEAGTDGSKKHKKGKGGASKAASSLKAIAENPLVADIVAAALIGMATALKDSDKGRRMAGKASDQLGKMSNDSAKQGNAMWDLALNIGRQALETLAEETKGKARKSR